MNPQMNMGGMNQVGGPIGQPRAMNNGASGIPRNVNAEESKDPKFELDSYIYDYFVKNEQYDVARAMKNCSGIRLNLAKDIKTSPSRREVNGMDESMDSDSKEDVRNRPDDLPPVNVGSGDLSVPFLHEWWCIFWDICQAQRNRGSNGAATQYLMHTQQRARVQQIERDQMLRQMAPGMLNQQYRNAMAGMQANGMSVPNEFQKRAMANNPRHSSGQQMANMRTFGQQPSQLMQTQMQRNGSGMEMDTQRPQSPSSVDNAPSPKRQRLEGQMTGPPMGPAGRAQMGVQNQFANFQNPGPEGRHKSMQIYSRQMVQNVESALNGQTMMKGMPNGTGVPQVMPQGAEGQMQMHEYYAGNPAAMRGGMPQNGQGNHALQDYQMQLMLLEQQNKKRLMMARQEQDSMARVDGSGPGGPPGGAGQPNFAPGMSPQGSRAGPSPGPNEQMKRGTPKMGQSGLPPSPLPDGSMPQGRGSPGPMNFDAGQIAPNMPPQFYQNMGQMGETMTGGPNGATMRPPSSHPNFPGQIPGQMNPQQLEAMSRQPSGVRMGSWPQGPGPGPAPMMHQVPPQPQPQGTPLQRNAAMPPPQAPTANAAGRTQPSSPQPPAPPTPSQSNKAPPKSKKDTKMNKKQTKKVSMTTNATPSSEAEPPATPTPATPITPMHPQSFNNANNSSSQKSGPAQQTTGPAPASVPAPAPPMSAPPPDLSQSIPPFGPIDGPDNGGFNLDFSALDGTDVLEGFDFDQFLNTDNGNDFSFDPNLGMNFSADGVEAGSGDV